jgi:hypothetical protein
MAESLTPTERLELRLALERAKSATLEFQIAESNLIAARGEVERLKAGLIKKYSLGLGDNINADTGELLRAPKPAPAPGAPEVITPGVPAPVDVPVSAPQPVEKKAEPTADAAPVAAS